MILAASAMGQVNKTTKAIRAYKHPNSMSTVSENDSVAINCIVNDSDVGLFPLRSERATFVSQKITRSHVSSIQR